MIITGKDLNPIIELAYDTRKAHVNAYKLDDMELLFAVLVRNLIEPFKAYRLGVHLGFHENDPRTLAETAIPTHVVTYSLWGFDTEKGAFVFKEDKK